MRARADRPSLNVACNNRPELSEREQNSASSRATLAVAAMALIASAVYRWGFAARPFFIDEIWVIEMRAGRYTPGAVPQPPLFFFGAVAASRLCGFGEACFRFPSLLASVLLNAGTNRVRLNI